MDQTFIAPPHVSSDRLFDFDMHADPRVTDDVQVSINDTLAEAPEIFYTPRHGGHWVVQRFDAIAEVLKNYEHFSAREMHIPRLENHPVFIPLSLDPPQSTPFRHVMMRAFSAKNVRALEPTIREWAARIVEAATAGEGCEFIADVASLYPVSIFMELMGMPLERLREFRTLTNAFFSAHDPVENQRLAGEILAILAALIEERRRTPGDDLVSDFLAAEIEGRPLSTEEVLAMCFLLFVAGMDTVTNVSGFAFRHLASDPGLQDRLRADADLIPQFVEESLRVFPVVNPSRLVIKDCDHLGVPMRAGDMVLCLPPTASRDPAANAEADRFQVERAQISHLTFGTGPHLCLGHILARAEIRILTEEWLQRIPRFHAPASAHRPFRMGVVMALESLHLAWEGVSAA